MSLVIFAGFFCEDYFFHELFLYVFLDNALHVQLKSNAFLWKSLKKKSISTFIYLFSLFCSVISVATK